MSGYAYQGTIDALALEIGKLKSENERLTAELDCPFRLARHSKRLIEELRAENAGLQTGYKAYEQVNAELRAEIEELKKDADRYRWIRKESNLSDYEDCYNLPMVHAWEYKPGPVLNEQFDSLDAAIDHAISSPENH